MTETWTYTPIVRLPKRRDSASPANRKSTIPQDTLQHKICEPENCLVSDTLYIVDLADSVREADVRTLMQHCLPIETSINRHQGNGYLRFSDAKLADRAYSLYNGFTFTNGAQLRLCITNNGHEPESNGPILEVKGLPTHIDNNLLYDLLRPFGPLRLCQLVMEDNVFRGKAFVQFFSQTASDEAQTGLHGKRFEGCTLAVAPLMSAESHESAAENTPKEQHNSKRNSTLPMLANSKKQAMDKAQSPSPNVDYLNLYIKNLDPSITNDYLHSLFSKFGNIVSARVMTHQNTGQSRGYGFVSYEKAEEAEAALNEMNGKIVASKALSVSYHEPKKARQQSQQVPPSNHHHPSYTGPVSHPVSVSPQQPVAVNYPASNHVSSLSLNASSFHPAADARVHSDLQPVYAPASGLGIEHDEQIKDLSVAQKQLVPPRKLSSAETLVFGVKPSPQFPSSPMSGTSTGRSLETLTGGMSIKRPPPHHPQPQTPQVYQKNGHLTMRRRGSIESIASVMTESSASRQRQKMTEAVMQCIDASRDPTDVVDMLLTLKRQERSLCLFNPDFLREKVQLAIAALDTFNEDDDEEMVDVDKNVVMEDPYARMTKLSPTAGEYTPRRPTKALQIVAPPPEIAVQPVAEERTNPGSTAISKQIKEVEDMLNAMSGKPIYEMKQQMGDRLFPLVKATGVKQAPKVTIRLLDTIDLHELAHIMFDKEKLTKQAMSIFAVLQQEK